MESATHLWESFLVIVGSSGAALTGLQFVVIAVINDARPNSSGAEIGTYATPTIVHFCAVLLVSAAMSAPWRTLTGGGATVAACGLFGLLYSAVVLRRVRRVTAYKPVLEDWIWHTGFPFVGYGVLLGGGIALVRGHPDAMFLIAASLMLLLYIGIHNAWDTVTYLTLNRGSLVEQPTAAQTPPVRKGKQRRR